MDGAWTCETEICLAVAVKILLSYLSDVLFVGTNTSHELFFL